MRNIKRFLNTKWVIHSLCITMFISYFPFLQEASSDCLKLGFPNKFYTVYDASRGFPIHFNIGIFILDIFEIYLIGLIIFIIVRKIKKIMRKSSCLDEKMETKTDK